MVDVEEISRHESKTLPAMLVPDIAKFLSDHGASEDYYFRGVAEAFPQVGVPEGRTVRASRRAGCVCGIVLLDLPSPWIGSTSLTEH
jgi:hypothetical protein